MIDTEPKRRERLMLEGFEAWVRHGTPFGLYGSLARPMRIKLWFVDDRV